MERQKHESREDERVKWGGNWETVKVSLGWHQHLRTNIYAKSNKFKYQLNTANLNQPNI